jgi:hypothetical protein
MRQRERNSGRKPKWPGVETKQIAFRCPGTILDKIDEKLSELEGAGITMLQSDLLRMLVAHNLDHPVEWYREKFLTR